MERPLNIKATNCDLTPEMRGVIEERISVVEKFMHGNEQFSASVEVELTTNQETEKQYRGEATVEIDGTVYRAEANGASVEEAFDEVRSELKKELRRAKGKKESLFRRGARKMKEMMRFGKYE